MNQLKVINQDGRLLVDSRDVASMTGKRHDNLVRDIDVYVKILSQNTELKIEVSKFFSESTYKDGTGRTLKCFLLTKMGCDMVANKMTGEKGILFTATYVNRFKEMELQLTQPIIPTTLVGALRLAADIEDKRLLLEQKVTEYEKKLTYLDQILESKGTITVTQIAKDYELSGIALNKILHEERVQYKQNEQWLLYATHTNKGYTQSTTIHFIDSKGNPDTTINTRWTQKGRLFIHEILAKRGIVPYMDRKDVV